MRSDLAAIILAYLLPQFIILSSAILLLDLQLPAYVRLGASAKLVCVYDLEFDGFYSLKWYKDGQEFYSYIPRLSTDPRRFFNVTGVQVDRFQSDNSQVVLQNISLDSAGEYKCQVSGEGPLFATHIEVKTLRVAAVPSGPPFISQLPSRYRPGDWLNLNCTSEMSNPPARLTWFVNGKEAEIGMLRRFESSYPTISPLAKIELQNETTPPGSLSHVNADENYFDEDSLDSGRKAAKTKAQNLELFNSVLGLQFWVHEEHYENGKLVVRCKAEIVDVFSRETETYLVGEHTVGPDKALQAISKASTQLGWTPETSRILVVTFIVLQIMFLRIVPSFV